MRIAATIVTILLFSTFTFSSQGPSDPFNSYQFNRDNAIKGKAEIDKSPWFEWWYYKIVIPEKNKSYYFVYGVVNPWDLGMKNQASRAYVSMGAFTEQLILEERFPVNEFQASYTNTDIKVADLNRATDTRVVGSIKESHKGQSSWDFSIEKKWAFNATGWTTGKNFTNIEWYPAQADARCTGAIEVNGERETFENAPCYQDRNWGRSFPKWWAWVVSNHFEGHPDTALAIGGGQPTLFNTLNRFKGVAVGLKHNGIEYTWRPHDQDPLLFKIRFGQWEITGFNKTHKIIVSADAPRSRFMDLQFMTPQGRIYHDYEALEGHVRVQLFERRPNKLKWRRMADLHSNKAGIEFGSFAELQN